MNALWTTPLGPIGLLLGGGGLLLATQRYLSARWQRLLPVVLVVSSMAAWLLLRLHSPGAGEWWVWQAPLELKTALGLQWDGWVWLVGWLLFAAALSALLLPGWSRRPGFTPPAFWIPLLLAGSLLVITAATWSTLLSAWAWMMFVAAVLAGSPVDNAPRAWSMLLLSVLFLLATPLFNGFESLLVVLSSESLNLQAQLLFLLAVVIPLGIYPFHLWLGSHSPRPLGVQLILHLLPGLAAFYWLGRFQIPLLGSLGWIVLVVAGLFGSAMAAWLSEDARLRWMYVVVNRATWAALAISLFHGESVARMIFPLTSFALAAVVWGLVEAETRRAWSWLRWLALFFLVGAPFSPGFALNRSLSRLANSIIGFPVWILVLVSQMLLVAAVLHPARIAAETQESAPRYEPAELRGWMLALVVIFGLLWGLLPSTLARTAGLTLAPAYASSLAQIRSAGLLTGWMTVLAPLALGWLLSRWRHRFFAGMETWQNRILTVVRLHWLEALLRTSLHYLALSLGFAADILDGAGQFGWVLLALLLFWLFMK